MTSVPMSVRPEDFHVLICDDEESIRSMLSEAVGNWGFQVATAPNGESALEYLAAGNLPHIILTDIRMGGITGIELAEKAKKISKEMEVIIMTSHGTFETAVQAMRIGVFDYISKPFDNIEDVRTTLIHVAERIYLKFYSEYLLTELTRKNSQIAAQSELTMELAKNLDLAKTLEIGSAGLSKAFGNGAVVFFQYIPSQDSLLATARFPANLFGGTSLKIMIPKSDASSPDSILDFFTNLESNTELSLLLEQGWSLNPPDLNLKVSSQVQTWKIKPLITRGVPRGAYAVLPQEWSGADSESLLKRYMQSIETAFENALLHAKVVQTSIKDSLTGLFNVRHFKERFASSMQTAGRLAHPVSLLFFDVDHFKKYNDTHGHPAGDVVLRMVADLMKKSFRGSDVLARYGGEEFVVLMPHTAFTDALEKAEGFRKLVEDTKFPGEHTQPLGKVTVSIGVSEFPSHGSTVEAVIKASDDALYDGKKKSRNVVVAGVPVEGYVPPFKSQIVRSQNQKGT